MLTEEQAESIKQRLISQIEKSFPDDKKDFAISQIQGMDSEHLEAFLVKNNLVKHGGSISPEQCVFCSIVSGNIESYKIAENQKAVAVLEINPISHGHIIVIPKEHLPSEGDVPEKVKELSEKVSGLIKARMNPEEIDVSYTNIMGHEIINLVPVYSGEKHASERKHAEKEELEELQKLLTKKTFSEKKPAEGRQKQANEKGKISKKIAEKIEKIWLPKRIP